MAQRVGSVVSWKHWDTGSIPGPEEWVKDPVLQLRSLLQLRSDLLSAQGLHMPQGGKKKKKKKEREGERSRYSSSKSSRDQSLNTGKGLEGTRRQKRNEPFSKWPCLIFPGIGSIPGKLGFSITLFPASQPRPTPLSQLLALPLL